MKNNNVLYYLLNTTFNVTAKPYSLVFRFKNIITILLAGNI